jgi:hypothetical protein
MKESKMDCFVASRLAMTAYADALIAFSTRDKAVQ